MSAAKSTLDARWMKIFVKENCFWLKKLLRYPTLQLMKSGNLESGVDRPRSRCRFVWYFCTLFWDDITIIWDEYIVYFLTEKNLFWSNKKFVYLIYINKLSGYHKITYENILKRTWTSLNITTGTFASSKKRSPSPNLKVAQGIKKCQRSSTKFKKLKNEAPGNKSKNR